MWGNTDTVITAKQGQLDMAQTKVVFNDIHLDHVAKTLTVSCIVDQDMWLGGNIVNIKGIHLEGTTKIPEGSEPRSAWVFKGHGPVQIFEKLVKISYFYY